MKIGVIITCLCLFTSPTRAKPRTSSVNTTTHSFLWPKEQDSRNFGKTVVQISVILPNNATYEASINKTGPGILQALDEAQNRGLTRGLEFQVTFRDSRCNGVFGPGSFNNAVFQGVDVIFGPTCEYALGKNDYRFPLERVGRNIAFHLPLWESCSKEKWLVERLILLLLEHVNATIDLIVQMLIYILRATVTTQWLLSSLRLLCMLWAVGH